MTLGADQPDQLARRGAKVIGVDFSAESVERARALSNELSIAAGFWVADVYRLKEVLSGQFDLGYTSYGVLCWLHDLAEWARMAAHFVTPGGRLVLIDDHPLAAAAADDGIGGNRLTLGCPICLATTLSGKSPPTAMRIARVLSPSMRAFSGRMVSARFFSRSLTRDFVSAASTSTFQKRPAPLPSGDQRRNQPILRPRRQAQMASPIAGAPPGAFGIATPAGLDLFLGSATIAHDHEQPSSPSIPRGLGIGHRRLPRRLENSP
jgi:SAM-dependent methyltransferase